VSDLTFARGSIHDLEEQVPLAVAMDREWVGYKRRWHVLHIFGCHDGIRLAPALR
jgi:hypothetical protein